MKLQELALDVGEGGISSNALQYLAKDQIGWRERLPRYLFVEPGCVRIRDAPKVVDP